jgi:hypothetical protein
MKKCLLIIFCLAASLSALSQVNIDSIKPRILSIQYDYAYTSYSTSRIPPGFFVHCELSCQERELFEKLTNDQWTKLLEENSKLGFYTAVLLYDLFKKNSIAFRHVRSMNMQEWDSIYWKVEVSEWKDYLKTHKYVYESCF